MKKSIIIFSFLFSITFSLFFSLFSNLNSNEINAASVRSQKLQIGEEQFDLPVHIYRCVYELQYQISYIANEEWIYPNGTSNPETKYWRESYFEITDEESLDKFSNSTYDGAYYIDQEDYMSYGNDALSSAFVIITKGKVFTSGEQLNGVTKSQLLQNHPEIVSVITSHEKEIEFELIDYGTPVIDGYEGIFATTVDDPVTIEEIKSNLKAFDNVDGDITSQISIKEDNYSDNKHKVGEYDVVFEVKDSSNNAATITITVSVLDIVSPIISGPDTFYSNISNPISYEEDISKEIQISDNYDIQVSDTLEFIEDTFSENSDKPGSYKIILRVHDQSGNTATKTITIISTDDIKPTISGNSTYTKSTETILSVSDIMKNMYAEDNYDGDITNRLTLKEDNYTKKQNKVGTYTLVFFVTDYSNNVSDDFIVTIKVEDTTLPYFTISDSIINISEYSTMSHEDITNFLRICGQIDGSMEATVTYIEDEYTSNTNIPGKYKMTAKVKYSNGEEKTINLTVNVKDNEAEDSENQSPNNSFISRIFNWFKNIFNTLKNLLSKLWNELINYLK